MELKEAEQLARTLMTQHGVGYLAFEFDGGKRRLGATHNMRIGNGKVIPLKITLSRHYVVLLPEHEVRDVILHEIAHALTPGHNHNAVFMNACRALGAKPARCASPSASPKAPITGNCVTCGKQMASQHRLPTAVYVCKVHRDRALQYYRDGVAIPFAKMPAKYQERVRYAMSRGTLK
jgi:hypothetical protein